MTIGTAELVGNETLNKIYESDLGLMPGWFKPTTQTPVETLKKFIHAKYVHRGFVDSPDPPQEAEGARGAQVGLVDRFLLAARENNVVEMIYCLAHGVDVNAVRAVPVAADDKHDSDGAQARVRGESSSDALLEDGMTAAHEACRSGCVEALNLATLNGADLSKIDENGLAPLDVAMLRGHTHVMEYCLQHMQAPSRPLPKTRSMVASRAAQ